jgi:hypothetical protein
MWLMKNHPTNPTIYVLAAAAVLLFAISFLFEEHASGQSQQFMTFEPPNISADQKNWPSG